MMLQMHEPRPSHCRDDHFLGLACHEKEVDDKGDLVGAGESQVTELIGFWAFRKEKWGNGETYNQVKAPDVCVSRSKQESQVASYGQQEEVRAPERAPICRDVLISPRVESDLDGYEHALRYP